MSIICTTHHFRLLLRSRIIIMLLTRFRLFIVHISISVAKIHISHETPKQFATFLRKYAIKLLPSPHLASKELDSEFKRQNTGVQHTKYRSTIGKVLRYKLVGTTNTDYGNNVNSLYLYCDYNPRALRRLEASGCCMPVKSENICIRSPVLPRLRILSRMS